MLLLMEVLSYLIPVRLHDRLRILALLEELVHGARSNKQSDAALYLQYLGWLSSKG